SFVFLRASHAVARHRAADRPGRGCGAPGAIEPLYGRDLAGRDCRLRGRVIRTCRASCNEGHAGDTCTIAIAYAGRETRDVRHERGNKDLLAPVSCLFSLRPGTY